MTEPCRIFAAVLAMLMVSAAAEAQTTVPRFAALRSAEVNMRTGPGTQYPVEWVFLRRGLPIEIVAEYDQWRKIRDSDGSIGWVHKSLLTGRRWVMITGEIRTLRRQPDAAAQAVLRAEAGVLGRLAACDGGWCRLEIDGAEGWLPRDQIWGVYSDEVVE